MQHQALPRIVENFLRALPRITLYAVLLAVAAGMIFPMFWMLMIALHEQPQSYPTFVAMVFSLPSLNNFYETISSGAFGRYFLNSTVIAVVVTAGNIVCCFMAGYALARREFLGKQALFSSILIVLVIPPHVIMIPLYRMMVAFGWINTYAALIVPWLVSPFGIFLVRQYVLNLPKDVEDAARIDGAGEWYILFRIVFPLCTPILTVLGIYVFLANWNSFLFPFVFTNDEAHRTLPVGLAFYQGKQSIDWGHLMAGASISAVPILTMFAFFQKEIIQGLTAGALKE